VRGQTVKLDPALLGKPPVDAWPTYHGDYSGRRFSTLKQINASNVKNLSLAWIYRLNTSAANAIVGGEGPDTPPGGPSGSMTIKSTPLMLNGILYFSSPDHVWAVDARTGREVWHFLWKTKGGDHIGNRGVGMYGEWLYFLTPDNYFVSLEAATGKERWHKVIANMKREYFSTNAPIIVGRHVIVGVGGDALDIPGYLESRDPESGEVVWRFNTTPRPGQLFQPLARTRRQCCRAIMSSVPRFPSPGRPRRSDSLSSALGRRRTVGRRRGTMAHPIQTRRS